MTIYTTPIQHNKCSTTSPAIQHHQKHLRRVVSFPKHFCPFQHFNSLDFHKKITYISNHRRPKITKSPEKYPPFVHVSAETNHTQTKGPPNTPPSTLQLCHTLPLPLSMRTIVTTTTTLSTIILTSVLIIGKSCWQIVERGVGVERNKTHPCNSFFSSCDHLSFVSLQWCIQSKTTATKKKMD